MDEKKLKETNINSQSSNEHVQSNSQEQTLEQLEQEAIAIEEVAKDLLHSESQYRPSSKNEKPVEANSHKKEETMNNNNFKNNGIKEETPVFKEIRSLKTKINVLSAFMVAVIAGAGVGAYYFNQHRFDDINELANKIEATRLDVSEKALKVESLSNDVKVKDARMDELFTQNSQIIANNNVIKTSTEDLKQLVELYGANTQSVSNRLKDYEDRKPNDWLIAQSFFLVSNAQNILELTDNVSAALLNLERADILLAKIDEDEIIRLREALSKDIAKLKALPVLDTRGMNLKLDCIYNAIPQMPLNEFLRANRDKFESEENAKTAEIKDWKNNLLESLKDFSSRFIEVRRRDENIVNQFLSPDQTKILMKNIQTEILLAKVAIFNQDQESFIQNLSQVNQQLKSYFDPSCELVASSLESLDELIKQTITYKSKGSLSSYDKFQNIATDRFHLYKVEMNSVDKSVQEKKPIKKQQTTTQPVARVNRSQEKVLASNVNLSTEKEGNK
ncbi:MAG: uroporphyrinogen-III C-methyltransferase [Succinivibrio sp.]|nr:uroporphyrinogen-III C-methyltransferase [Succinivibrio sp.]